MIKSKMTIIVIIIADDTLELSPSQLLNFKPKK